MSHDAIFFAGKNDLTAKYFQRAFYLRADGAWKKEKFGHVSFALKFYNEDWEIMILFN